MKAAILVFKRELKSFFQSPLTYVMSAVFMGLMGYLFFNVFLMADQIKNIPFNAAVMRPLFGNMNTLFIFIVPLFSMKLITEDTKNGSINLLFLSPLKDWQILLGKWMAGASIIIFLMALTFIFPIILHFSGYSNWEASITGYFGVFLNANCYLMFSIFIASLTKQPAFATVSSIIGILMFVGLAWTSQTTDNPAVAKLFEQLSLSVHFEPFSRGVIKSYDISYFMLFFLFFWLLSLRSIDSRNW